MGFFSWKTQDTDVSIPSVYSSRLPLAKVTMTDNKGNKWTETNYEGYGIFGGKDYYELLAEMNGKKTREEGISLNFSRKNEVCLYPNLNEDPDIPWKNEEPEHCEFQGFFY